MLIQLRRVVYLLVLLQCCVCVVHASDAGGRVALSGENRELEEAERKVRELVKDSETALSEAGGCLRILEREEEWCRANISVILNPHKKVKGLWDEIEAVWRKLGDRDENVPGGFEELFNKTTTSVLEAKEAVTNTRLSEARTRKVREMCRPRFEDAYRLEMELNGTRNRYTDILEKENNKERSPERVGLVENSKKRHMELRTLSGFLAGAEKNSTKTEWEARTETSGAVSGVSSAVRLLGRVVEKFKSDQQTKFSARLKELKAIGESLWGETANVGLADVEAEVMQTQKKKRQPIVGDEKKTEKGEQAQRAGEGGERKEEEQARRNGETQVKGEKADGAEEGDGKAKEGAVGKNKGEKERKEINTPNGSKITEGVERDVGVHNPIKNPQKPNETSTAAPGTVNTGSGGVASGSHSSSLSSSGTMHFNVSGLSDSSSSPVLLHSPLLLLLLCVLGSILVF